MTVHYDLVVIGGSPEGVYAAANAATLKARVALVTQGWNEYLQGSEAIFSRVLAEVANVCEKIEGDCFNLYPLPSKQEQEVAIDATKGIKEAIIWAESVISKLNSYNSLSSLAASGVDVISDRGEFCRLPHLAFNVNNRQLRSRSYAIATGSRSTVPKIDGDELVDCFTLSDLWQKDKLHFLGNDLVIVGGSAIAIELAQSLTKLGKNVSLVLEEARLLPKEDPEISMLIQAQLEADGVKIFTDSPITQLKKIADKKWVQAGTTAIETDEVIFLEHKQPNLENLNLEGVGVKFDRQGIVVNRKLQTTNPNIYAYGDAIACYSFTHVAQHEANIALKNALFLPQSSVDYSFIPWTIFTQPNLAKVGLTEAQAKQRYGKNVYTLKQYFKENIKAVILGKTTGLCKLIIRSDGLILGGYILGEETGELISAIALAIKNKIKLKNFLNTDFPHISLTCSSILQKTAIDFHQQKLNNNRTMLNLLETWFRWRRG
jgi:pyruvate/2-oxoglutarate dehydrogenase complex dihydrolipoamide dehydrogenase (E3) component